MPRNGPGRKASGSGSRRSPPSGDIRSSPARQARSGPAPPAGWWHASGGLDAARQGRRTGQHPARMGTQNRVPPTGRGRHQRHQDKPASMEFRMRENQPSLHAIPAATADDTSAEIQNVQIERPGFPPAPLSASGVALEPLQETQEHARADRTVHTNNHVHVIGLPTNSERSGAIKRRACENVEPGTFEIVDRPAQGNSGPPPRTRNIRSKTNPDIIRAYSQGMVPADDASNLYDSAYT